MALPRPAPGLVIRYAYLWRYEHNRGRDEGRKDRPCVVVLASRVEGKEIVVFVAPVTSRQPSDPKHTVLLPAKVKRHLGLDDRSSWIVADELNRFVWPGPDLQRIRAGKRQEFEYGFLPKETFAELAKKVLEMRCTGALRVTSR